jgi:SAM-dependent methyltransferase
MNVKDGLKRHPILLSLARAGVGVYRDVRALVRTRRLVRRRAGLVTAYLAAHPVRKLQLGAGTAALPGWLNTDLRPRCPSDAFLDAGEPFPFDDHTFDYVFSEHFIHFLEYPGAKQALRECYRVLKPGGKVRIAETNLWSFIRLCRDDTPEMLDHVRWYIDHIIPWADRVAGGFVLNNELKDERFLFDPQTLRMALEGAGFVDVTECPVGQSEDEHLRGIESHGKVIGNEALGNFETFVMEARRP